MPRPAAKPSRPSTKLIALMSRTVKNAVSRVLCNWSRTTVVPPPKGMKSSVQVRPSPLIKVAAKSWPKSFTMALSSTKSSTTPTSTSARAAQSTAFISGVTGIKPRVKAGSWAARNIAAAKPVNMATPPMRGVGCVWASRSRISATRPVRTKKERTTPVVRYVNAAATRMTRASSRSGTPLPLTRMPP